MSKKLLSVLVVLALALSMVPVVGLPATKANAATFNNANLEDADTETEGLQAICPHCNGTAVTWTALNDVVSASEYTVPAGHYYLSGALTRESKADFLRIAASTSVCLHLNGNNLTYGGRIIVMTGATFNVMGNGNVTWQGCNVTSEQTGIHIKGIVNIYGGTWQNAADVTYPIMQPRAGTAKTFIINLTGTAHIVSKISMDKSGGLVTLDQEAVADFVYLTTSGGYLNVESTWSGQASVNVANVNALARISAESGYTGELYRINSSGVAYGKLEDLDGDGAGFTTYNAFMNNTWYTDIAAAVSSDAYTEGNVIKIYAYSTLATTAGASYYIDLNGCTAKLSGAGTVYLLNSANDGYDNTAGKATIADGSTVEIKNDVTVDGKRYITICDDSGNYTAHRLEMAINTVTLKTSNAGLYFKASYKCDDVLAAAITNYGIAVSKSAITGKVGDEGIGYSELDGFATNMTDNTVTGNSGAVTGIFKEGADNNLARAATEIFAKSYIKIGDDVIMGTESIGCSLQEVLQKAYANGQAEAVNTFVNGWTVKDENITAGNLGLTA